ncbi:MAG: dephospho-CoA kinase [Gammaproteobacteria bacterium]|nr:dephospho-CoA kinase [Gammaproteobacteria bacterium]
MTVIGLTGGIASGKSTAARHLGELGAHVIDADLLGHRAYEPGTLAFAGVVETFGQDIVNDDGQIDRKALGGKVFGNPAALKQLTDIVWPEIRRLAEAEIALQDAATTVVLEAAVLFEAGWEDVVDEIWVVIVARDIAVARAMSRDGAVEAAVQARIDSQLSNEERTARADVVIDNEGSEQDLYQRVDTQWQRVTQAASKGTGS